MKLLIPIFTVIGSVFGVSIFLDYYNTTTIPRKFIFVFIFVVTIFIAVLIKTYFAHRLPKR